MVAGVFERRCHAHDTGDILRTGALAALLGAALDQVRQCQTTTAVQRTHALGAVELVTGEAEHIDVLFSHVDVQMTCHLDSIGMEQNAGFLTHSADLGNRQHRADLVVGIHDGDQTGIFPNGVLHLLGGDVVTLGNVQKGHLVAQFFQFLQGMQHSMMLESGGNDVLFALSCAQSGCGKNCLIVGLAAAGGKINLSGVTAQAIGHGLPRFVQDFLCLLTYRVQAGGVAEHFIKIRQHCLHRQTAGGSGCCIISINTHSFFSFSNYLLILWVIYHLLPSMSMGKTNYFPFVGGGAPDAPKMPLFICKRAVESPAPTIIFLPFISIFFDFYKGYDVALLAY